MARLNVEIPDSILGEEKAKELAKARRRIKTLEARVQLLERTHEQAKYVLKQYQNFRSLVSDSLDLHLDYYE